MEPTSNQDAVLAAFLEPGALPDIAKRVNMSLAALATWTNKNIELLEGVHKALVTRCKLIAAQLELSALTALSTVSSAVTATDDPKLRERSLERQRKAAGAILRHNTSLGRTLRASADPSAPSSNAESRMANAASSLDASMPHASMPSSSRTSPTKLPLAQRLAARKLAALSAT